MLRSCNVFLALGSCSAVECHDRPSVTNTNGYENPVKRPRLEIKNNAGFPVLLGRIKSDLIDDLCDRCLASIKQACKENASPLPTENKKDDAEEKACTNKDDAEEKACTNKDDAEEKACTNNDAEIPPESSTVILKARERMLKYFESLNANYHAYLHATRGEKDECISILTNSPFQESMFSAVYNLEFSTKKEMRMFKKTLFACTNLKCIDCRPLLQRFQSMYLDVLSMWRYPENYLNRKSIRALKEEHSTDNSIKTSKEEHSTDNSIKASKGEPSTDYSIKASKGEPSTDYSIKASKGEPSTDYSIKASKKREHANYHEKYRTFLGLLNDKKTLASNIKNLFRNITCKGHLSVGRMEIQYSNIVMEKLFAESDISKEAVMECVKPFSRMALRIMSFSNIFFLANFANANFSNCKAVDAKNAQLINKAIRLALVNSELEAGESVYNLLRFYRLGNKLPFTLFARVIDRLSDVIHTYVGREDRDAFNNIHYELILKTLNSYELAHLNPESMWCFGQIRSCLAQCDADAKSMDRYWGATAKSSILQLNRQQFLARQPSEIARIAILKRIDCLEKLYIDAILVHQACPNVLKIVYHLCKTSSFGYLNAFFTEISKKTTVLQVLETLNAIANLRNCEMSIKMAILHELVACGVINGCNHSRLVNAIKESKILIVTYALALASVVNKTEDSKSLSDKENGASDHYYASNSNEYASHSSYLAIYEDVRIEHPEIFESADFCKNHPYYTGYHLLLAYDALIKPAQMPSLPTARNSLSHSGDARTNKNAWSCPHLKNEAFYLSLWRCLEPSTEIPRRNPCYKELEQIRIKAFHEIKSRLNCSSRHNLIGNIHDLMRSNVSLYDIKTIYLQLDPDYNEILYKVHNKFIESQINNDQGKAPHSKFIPC